MRIYPGLRCFAGAFKKVASRCDENEEQDHASGLQCVPLQVGTRGIITRHEYLAFEPCNNPTICLRRDGSRIRDNK